MIERLRTTCMRNCPDACGLLVDVEDGVVKSVSGDPDHPVTRGFICRRTKRDWPAMLTRTDRIVEPRLRTASGFVSIGWDQALDLCAERLRTLARQKGPQTIFFMQNGGSMGLSSEPCRYLFEELGATAMSGGVCMDAGEWAQEQDFGEQRVSDWKGFEASAALVLWGRNPFISSPHLLPDIRALRARGGQVVVVDPLPTEARSLATLCVQPRPGTDPILALGVARVLAEEGWIHPEAGQFCDGLDGFLALLRARTVEQAAALCDVPANQIRALAALYGKTHPTATWIGGGLQRRVDGAEAVRLIDALCAVAGQIGVRGAGAWYETPRRRGLDLAPARTQRSVRAAFLGQDLLAAKDPPIRFGWIQRANPVATFPESATIERALRSLEFLVVVDAYMSETAACAHLVLPPALMLEHEDLVGSYGHQRIGLARRIVAPLGQARPDLEIVQGLAGRLGLEKLVAGTAREWIDRFLKPLGLSAQALEAGSVARPGEPEVAFAKRRFATPSGKANLITECELHQHKADGLPLHLLIVAPLAWQGAQVPVALRDGLAEVFAHPDAPGIAGRPDGAEVRVITGAGSLKARLRLDAAMRKDTLRMHRGQGGANRLVSARQSRHGGQAAFLDERARLE
jgi:anaerobic selenocysteine-containing dehydrogenase